MADFAPNFTGRYRLRYSFFGTQHSMQWRVAADTESITGLVSKIELFLSDLAPRLWSDWTVLGGDFAPADSDIFLPAAAPASPTGTGDPGDRVNTDKAVSISFVGRSSGGEKARMFLYGTTLAASFLRATPGNDFKLLSTEVAQISDAIVRLNETAPNIVANDNNPVTWYEYVNLKYNDRWVRRLRRG